MKTLRKEFDSPAHKAGFSFPTKMRSYHCINVPSMLKMNELRISVSIATRLPQIKLKTLLAQHFNPIFNFQKETGQTIPGNAKLDHCNLFTIIIHLTK